MDNNRKRKHSSILLTSFFILLFCSSLTNEILASPIFPIVKPTLTMDFLLVIKDSPTMVNLNEKQLSNSPIEEFRIISQPEFGKIQVNNVGSFTFVPAPNTCEEKDQFTYLIRTAAGFDTVTVSVEILCESLTILNGFSPSGDGEVDTFTILGIQNFPNNSLIVFNKWGEEVYAKKGYSNEWKGETSDGDSLASEDSLYYYVFNNGEGDSYSGYVQIM